MNERTDTGKYHRHDAAQTRKFLIAVRGKMAIAGSRSQGCELSRHPSPSVDQHSSQERLQ
jgi:hypothetical protein